MADDLNALLQANHASTVLQGIMNPAQVNPLAAITSANQAAQAEFNTRKMQAQQVAGQLATESIDPVTKQFDPAAYNAKIARAGPSVAMYAQPALQDASTLSQTQLAQQHAKAGYIQGVIGALDDNSTPDQVNGALDRAASNGMFTPTDIQNMRAHVPTNQAQMPAFIQQLRLIGGSVQQQLQQSGGRLGMSAEDQNQWVQVPYPQFNPDGTANPNYGKTFPMRKGDATPLLATPGQVQGHGDGGGLPSSLRNPANTAPAGAVPAAPPATTTGPTTAPPATGGNTGIGTVLGGSQAPPAATLPLPPTPPAVVPPPAPLPTAPGAVWNQNNPVGTSSTVAPADPLAAQKAQAAATGKPVQVPGGGFVLPNGGFSGSPPAPATPVPYGPRADIQGGVPVASADNALQPNVGAPGPPSPLVAGDVNAIMAGMQRGATPTAGAAVAGSPTYFGTQPSTADIDQQKRQVEQGATGFQAISDQAVQSRSRSAILGNMLGDTTQFSTGPLTSKIATLRNIANRIGLPVNVEGLSAQESFNKLAAQLANASNPGSDARLNVNQAANPHEELSPQGVDLMLRQLQGNEDYWQARAKLAASYGDQTDIKKFESDVGAKVDPRAFQFARMTPAQRQTYDKGLSATDRAAVRSSYNWLSNQPGLMGN